MDSRGAVNQPLFRTLTGLIVVALAAAIAVAIIQPNKGRGALGTDLGGSHALNEQSIIVTAGGQVGDFAASIYVHSSVPVTIESATLIPAKGYFVPRLVGVVLGSYRNEYEGRGWPITAASAGVPIHDLPAQAAHGPGWLYFGIVGRSNGALTKYADLGLRVTYRASGHAFTTNAWGPSVLCIGAHLNICPVTHDFDNLAAQVP